VVICGHDSSCFFNIGGWNFRFIIGILFISDFLWPHSGDVMPFTQDSEQQNQTPSRARMPWTQRRPTEMPMWFFIPKITGQFHLCHFWVFLENLRWRKWSPFNPPPKRPSEAGNLRNSGSETPSPSHQKITYIHIRIPCRLRPITNKQSTKKQLKNFTTHSAATC